MAERESIEELPTLEWRQLTDAPAPADDEAIGMELDTQPPTVDAEALLVEATPVEATPVEPLSAPVVINVPTPPVEEPETSWELPSEADTVPPTPLPTDETVEEVRDSSPVAPMTAETLLDSLPPDEELPPINDLDAAMAGSKSWPPVRTRLLKTCQRGRPGPHLEAADGGRAVAG